MSTYRIDDGTEAVARYQTYLDRVLGGVYMSGVFDERTRRATLKYQEKKGLPAVGRVDFSTFDSVYRDYKAALLSDAYAATWHGASPLPLYEGYYGDDMIHLGGIISSLAVLLSPVSSLRYCNARRSTGTVLAPSTALNSNTEQRERIAL